MTLQSPNIYEINVRLKDKIGEFQRVNDENVRVASSEIRRLNSELKLTKEELLRLENQLVDRASVIGFQKERIKSLVAHIQKGEFLEFQGSELGLEHATENRPHDQPNLFSETNLEFLELKREGGLQMLRDAHAFHEQKAAVAFFRTWKSQTDWSVSLFLWRTDLEHQRKLRDSIKCFSFWAGLGRVLWATKKRKQMEQRENMIDLVSLIRWWNLESRSICRSRAQHAIAAQFNSKSATRSSLLRWRGAIKSRELEQEEIASRWHSRLIVRKVFRKFSRTVSFLMRLRQLQDVVERRHDRMALSFVVGKFKEGHQDAIAFSAAINGGAHILGLVCVFRPVIKALRKAMANYRWREKKALMSVESAHVSFIKNPTFIVPSIDTEGLGGPSGAHSGAKEAKEAEFPSVKTPTDGDSALVTLSFVQYKQLRDSQVQGSVLIKKKSEEVSALVEANRRTETHMKIFEQQVLELKKKLLSLVDEYERKNLDFQRRMSDKENDVLKLEGQVKVYDSVLAEYSSELELMRQVVASMVRSHEDAKKSSDAASEVQGSPSNNRNRSGDSRDSMSRLVTSVNRVSSCLDSLFRGGDASSVNSFLPDGRD